MIDIKKQHTVAGMRREYDKITISGGYLGVGDGPVAPQKILEDNKTIVFYSKTMEMRDVILPKQSGCLPIFGQVSATYYNYMLFISRTEIAIFAHLPPIENGCRTHIPPRGTVYT